MPAPISLPKSVYKILAEAPPSVLPDALPLSELDAKDGFIHLSTAEQVPATAGRFFATNETLWLLQIGYHRIEKNVKWEDSGDSSFPHLYGSMPGKAEIISVKKFEKRAGEDWRAILENDAWLV